MININKQFAIVLCPWRIGGFYLSCDGFSTIFGIDLDAPLIKIVTLLPFPIHLPLRAAVKA